MKRQEGRLEKKTTTINPIEKSTIERGLKNLELHNLKK